MTPSRAADPGPRPRGPSASLGEVATPTGTPCLSPGATIGCFLAAGDRVLRLPASCRRSAPARLLSSRSSVPPCGTLEQQPLGIRRVAAQVVGHGGRLRGAWPPPRWGCRSRATAPEDQTGQLRRDAVIDPRQLLPSRMLGEPRVGAWFGRPRPPQPYRGGQQCRVSPADATSPAAAGLVGAAIRPAGRGLRHWGRPHCGH